MNGYSRIKSLHSIESSDDFLSSPQTKHKTNPPQETKTHEHPSQMEDGDASTEKRSGFGAPKFHRNSSVSSSSSSSTSSMQVSAVKKAFSMRRSSSVSERYCRIHDQHVALASPPDDEEFGRGMDGHGFGSFNKEKRSGNGRKGILKSCKRIFGF
ncbi:hypothetical protein Pfo_002243 [Paulownia fortunei]|nr:hypothetical protein Pfo_002243 [Paulownia fortunei]